jgi:hypothetical protein
VFRDQIDIVESETLTASWSFDGRELTLENLTGASDCAPATVLTTHPWVLVDAADQAASTSDVSSLDARARRR